jgi:hypothetical protein
LLDEWVVGLTRYTAEPAGVFEDPALFARSFTEAATRVRAFAWGAGEVQPTTLADDVTTFELQGYDYSVAVRRLTVSSPEQLAAEAEACHAGRGPGGARRAGPPAGGRGAGQRHGAPRSSEEADALGALHRYRDVTRGLASTGAAWSFPSADEGPAYAYCGAGHPARRDPAGAPPAACLRSVTCLTVDHTGRLPDYGPMRSPSVLSRLAALLPLLLCLSFSAPAPVAAQTEGGDTLEGQDEAAIAEARERYAQGAEFFRRERYSAAIAELTEAYRLWQNPTILFALAQAYEGDSQVLAAIETYQRYLDTTPRATRGVRTWRAASAC